jgi:hypothetical protein
MLSHVRFSGWHSASLALRELSLIPVLVCIMCMDYKLSPYHGRLQMPTVVHTEFATKGSISFQYNLKSKLIKYVSMTSTL